MRHVSRSPDQGRGARGPFRAALLIGLLWGTPVSARAQTDAGDRAVTEAALADFARRYAANSGSAGPRALVFDPAIQQLAWSEAEAAAVLQRTTRHRDSAESAALAKALGGARLLPEGELGVCLRNSRPGGCQVPDLLAVLGVTVAEPAASGDTATVLYRTWGSYERTPGVITMGRSGATYLARVVRSNGVWAVRCTAPVATDAPALPATILAACPP
jgi:hypothetical protein